MALDGLLEGLVAGDLGELEEVDALGECGTGDRDGSDARCVSGEDVDEPRGKGAHTPGPPGRVHQARRQPLA